MIKSSRWIEDQCKVPDYTVHDGSGIIQYASEPLSLYLKQMMSLTEVLADANLGPDSTHLYKPVVPTTEAGKAVFKPLIEDFCIDRLSSHHSYLPLLIYCPEIGAYKSKESFNLPDNVVIQCNVIDGNAIFNRSERKIIVKTSNKTIIPYSTQLYDKHVEVYFLSVGLW